MADAESSKTTPQNRLNQARANFEPQLDDLGLSIEKLKIQTAEELRGSLEKVNYYITHPENFASGGVQFKFWILEFDSKLALLPILLERKAFILDRLRVVEDEEKMHTLRDFIAKRITDTETRREFENQLDALERNSQQISAESHALVQRQNLFVLEKERQILQMESLERRSKVWLSFLEKESASTLIGAIILILITTCLIVAMFLGRDTLQVLGNGFLVILGYFFGQASRRPIPNERITG
jgi:hypothetical protein